jgi:hypothetical protein
MDQSLTNKKLNEIKAAIKDKDVRSLMRIWNESFDHGLGGYLERVLIEVESPKLCGKLTKYDYKFLFVDKCSFLQLIDVWRKRKLTKAIMKGKTEKLERLLGDPNFSSSYLSLRNFARNSDELILYLYGYILSIHNQKKGMIDLVGVMKEFIRRVYGITDPVRQIEMVGGFFDRLSYYVRGKELVALTSSLINDNFFKGTFGSNY